MSVMSCARAPAFYYYLCMRGRVCMCARSRKTSRKFRRNTPRFRGPLRRVIQTAYLCGMKQKRQRDMRNTERGHENLTGKNNSPAFRGESESSIFASSINPKGVMNNPENPTGKIIPRRLAAKANPLSLRRQSIRKAPRRTKKFPPKKIFPRRPATNENNVSSHRKSNN